MNSEIKSHGQVAIVESREKVGNSAAEGSHKQEYLEKWEKLGEDTVLKLIVGQNDTIFVTTTNKPAYPLVLVNYYNKVILNEKSSLPESILKKSYIFVESTDAFTRTMSYFFFVSRIIRNFPGINTLNTLKTEMKWEKLGEDTVLKLIVGQNDTIFVTTTNKPAYPLVLVNYYNKVILNEKSSLPESILKKSYIFVESTDAFTRTMSYFFFVSRIIRNFPGINTLNTLKTEMVG
ncbi:hypothetical protein Glove_21g324 [Diversispora epigaea]|uniref:Uncharacterized protein n=1 Tax=Diversispora epigaea TaxID=1348612 RepID=A0A397JL51_9GLOM|nr:hypothetical protein Glove_21g324 [Diversispora epigaea]